MTYDTFDKLISLCAGAGIALVILLIILTFTGYFCEQKAKQNETQHRHSISAGCSLYHNPSGMWVPADSYRAGG